MAKKWWVLEKSSNVEELEELNSINWMTLISPLTDPTCDFVLFFGERAILPFNCDNLFENFITKTS